MAVSRIARPIVALARNPEPNTLPRLLSPSRSPDRAVDQQQRRRAGGALPDALGRVALAREAPSQAASTTGKYSGRHPAMRRVDRGRADRAGSVQVRHGGRRRRPAHGRSGPGTRRGRTRSPGPPAARRSSPGRRSTPSAAHGVHVHPGEPAPSVHGHQDVAPLCQPWSRVSLLRRRPMADVSLCAIRTDALSAHTSPTEPRPVKATRVARRRRAPTCDVRSVRLTACEPRHMFGM